MSTIAKNKLNHLISNWPRGAIFTQAHLSSLGVTGENVKKYRQNHWISNIGRGAYRLPNDPVDFFSGLNALQEQLDIPIHIGGKTVIELRGYGHNIALGHSQYFLFASPGVVVPKWFLDYDWQGKLIIKKSKFLPLRPQDSFSDYSHNGLNVTASSLERAILELLYHIPKHQGFEEAARIIEGMQNMRIKVLQKLLENCQSVKVNRLLLFFADRLNLPWFPKLELKRINLGSGKRVIQPEGKLDKKYLITVPSDSLI